MPNINRLTKVMLAVALLPMLVLSTQLFGQSASSISGSVKDASQAVLPNSNVTVLNTATGVTSSQSTNNSGIYNFPSLQPGIYKVTAEAKGFQTASKTDVKLGMGSQIRLDFDMQVSGGSTEIEVSTSADNLTLEAGSSTGTVLQQESVTQLPLASNDVMDLINIMGGVVKSENPIFSNSEQTFAGVQSNNVNIQRDGITVNEVRYNSGIISPIRVNQEMVGEFKMVLSPVDAEMGRGAGQVQILTKSGSNQFHGSGVWNVQNSALDANDWYMKRTGAKPNWRNLNNYTLSASGPIIKNKTFFFATWDQQIVRSKALVKSRSLTPCARKGIYRYLSGIVNGNALQQPQANGTLPTRPVVYGQVMFDGSTPDASTWGNPVLTYDGTLPSGVPATGQLRVESVLGQLDPEVKDDLLTDYDCSGYNFDPLGVNGAAYTGLRSDSLAWDRGRANFNANLMTYDKSGYVWRFTNGFEGFKGMPPVNDWGVGDGLNNASHTWTRTLHGSDTVFGSGEDNERKSITFKVDHNINNSHRISGTYTYETDLGEDAYPTWPEEYGGYGGAVDRQPQSFTVTLTSTLRPTLLNEFRFGLSRTLTHTNEPFNNPKSGDKIMAIIKELMPTPADKYPNYAGQPLLIGLGNGSTEFATDTFSWFGSGGSSHPYGSRGNLPATWGGNDPRWSASDTITWTRGAHSFKGGVEARFARSWQDTNGSAEFADSANTFPSIKGGVMPGSSYVNYTFKDLPNSDGSDVDGYWTDMLGTDTTQTTNGNVPGAYNLLNYMYGSVGNIRQWYFVKRKGDVASWNSPGTGELTQTLDMRNREFSFFFKDDWKVSSSLTLNLGFRYEYYGIPYESNGQTVALVGGTDSLWGMSDVGFNNWMPAPEDLAARDNGEGGLFQTMYQYVGKNSPNPDISPWNKDTNNFAPHIGFAWQLPWFGKGKTTLRGGYSVSYSPLGNFDTYSGIMAKVPGTTYKQTWTGGKAFDGVETLNYLNLDTLGKRVPLTDPSTLTTPVLPMRSPITARAGGVTVYDENIKNPYVQSLNMSMTRNIGNNLTFDIRYIATLGRKSISSINLNTVNYRNNGLLEALELARSGQTSPLLDSLIPAFSLWFSASGTDQVRTYYGTSGALMQGNYSAVAGSLATANAWNATSTGVGGGVLRSGCLLSQRSNGLPSGTCSGSTPENFIYTNPQYGSANINMNLGHSNYHSMQAQVTMRPTRGLSFQTTYTWSRNLSDQGLTDYRGLKDPSIDAPREYYISGQHRSHQLTSYGTFDLPMGANGFIFRNATGAFKKAVEGWQMSWIASLTSGLPGSISGYSRLWGNSKVDLVDPSLWDNKAGKVSWANKAQQGYFYGQGKYVRGVDSVYCDNLASALRSACKTTGSGWMVLGIDRPDSKGAFNNRWDDGTTKEADNITIIPREPVVFQNADPGSTGNYGLNTLAGPGRWSLDMAMGKSIEFMEGKKIDFRIDAQNIFNHATPSGGTAYAWNARFTQIYNPEFGLNSGTAFGQLGSKGGHRTFQAKIRISF